MIIDCELLDDTGFTEYEDHCRTCHDDDARRIGTRVDIEYDLCCGGLEAFLANEASIIQLLEEEQNV